MPGIGDELGLLRPRLLQSFQHLVKGCGQLSHLVIIGYFDGAQIIGLRHVIHCAFQARNGLHAGFGHDETSKDGEQNAKRNNNQQNCAEDGDEFLGRSQRLRNDNGRA